MAFSDITTPDETVENEAMRYQQICKPHNLVQRPVGFCALKMISESAPVCDILFVCVNGWVYLLNCI